MYRLWSQLEHAARAPHAPPEIAVVDLAGFALDLALWGVEATGLPFLDPPPPRAMAEAHELLRRLDAVDAEHRPTSIGRRMADLPLHPRLAHMVVRALDLDDGAVGTAVALAALLEDRDVLRGRPDEVTTDAAERVRLIADRTARHHQGDIGAVAGARRRAGQLLRRAGRSPAVLERADPDRAGLVLALAYPDRIAQRRGNGRFRLRTGGGAWLPATDPLGDQAFIVAADVQPDRKADGRIRLAASLDADDVVMAAGGDVVTATTIAWDRARNDVRQRTERRLDGLVLMAVEGPADAADARAVEVLVDHVRSTRLAALHWSDGARDLQHRASFAARRDARVVWPEIDDATLLATLDDWLAPELRARRAAGRADLEAVDLVRLLRNLLGHHLVRRLEEIVPRSLTLARGRTVPVQVDVEGRRPTVRVKVQDAFGTARVPGTHPTLAGEPIVFELLSPAGRPVQVTADLPGFWAGSWAGVRKDLAGRYPKHDWPVDPTAEDGGKRRPHG